MGWGGNHGGKGAREVAAAFYAGRRLTRGNAKTDGRTYWLFDKAIARRESTDDIPALVAKKLVSGRALRVLEFTWAGWPTPTTEAHLTALGVPGVWKGSESQRRPRKPELCGKPVDPSTWYTYGELDSLPQYVPPPRRKITRFVNLTMPLEFA